MSRRQSRVSIDVRQNDTLLEFENYKKKFLLANKHITKLNSTLSVRIEELNAQISVLHVENLRLRASEIALATQLKKEREKSRKVIAEAEAATHHFMKSLGYIRKTHNVTHTNPNTPERHPPSLRARRPIINPDATPPMNRIARAPNIPGIHEEDEGNASSPDSPEGDPDDDGPPTSPTPPIRKKSKPRSSGSRLPLPTRSSSPPLPPPPELPDLDFGDPVLKAGKRKPTRRQSGLLTTSMSITTTITEVVPPRSPSPTFGSPPRQTAALEEEEEEVMAVIGGIDGGEDVEPTLIAQSITRRERKKKPRERDVLAERDHEMLAESSRKDKKKSRDGESLRATLEGSRKSRLKDVTNSPPSSSPLPPLDTNIVDDRECDAPTSASSVATTSTFASTRTFLTTPATTPAPSLRSSTEPHSYPLTPHSSSPIPPPPPPEPSDLDPPAGGRERRVRKSINYAEPKLNTKMRKPDPPPSTSKRASMSTVEKPRSSLELQLPTSSSSNSTASGSADDAPLPPPAPTPVIAPSTIGMKRKKSRSHNVPGDDEEESDGAQADAEYGGLRAGWINVDGRRRSAQGSRSLGRYEGDDGRRHSIAT